MQLCHAPFNLRDAAACAAATSLFAGFLATHAEQKVQQQRVTCAHRTQMLVVNELLVRVGLLKGEGKAVLLPGAHLTAAWNHIALLVTNREYAMHCLQY